MSYTPPDDYHKTTPLSGSIFAVTSSEVSTKTHWKRRLVILVYPIVLLLIDIILITAIFSIGIHLSSDADFLNSISRRVLLAVILPSILGVYLVGGYNYATDKRKYRFISEHVIMSVGVAILTFSLIYSIVAYGMDLKSPRLVVAGTLVVFPIISILYRVFLARIQAYFERDNAVCIIGAGDRAQDLYRRLIARGLAHEFVVVSFDPNKIGKHLIADDFDSPIIKDSKEVTFQSSIRGKYVESYIVASPMERIPHEFSRRMVSALFHRHKIYTYEAYLAYALRIEPPSQLTINWPMLDGFRLNRSVTYDRLKRLCDIGAAIVGIILASPLIIGTALAVKLTSKGPIIFKQERTGFREKSFMILKFRSMRVGSEKGPKYTQVNDDRFTPIGKFIRKTRLDELPQLWNVLVGDLSLIGPRAEWVDLVKGYEERFPFYHFRHAVKPGITGWAQVNYSYGANDEDTLEKLNYDLYYVRRYSLTLDVAIVVKTFYMMLFGKGM
ncbi:exopolysaccharide biosynthesis polyprenyl glycosylphosphotransferase [Rubritalea spongiae]|uniref:Exopolysaccharide biosynthesis polyprenyl glycosylphosphotransferase n=1 Tax=Rubritalea spongiae TaxID=430797 RepID=A0ABW5E2B4_9BACT